MAQGHPRSVGSVHEMPSQLIAGHSGAHLSSQLWPEAYNRRIVVQAHLSKKQDLISKITRAKRSGGMAQVVEHLPSKCETLSSNPSTGKKKKVISVQVIMCT
jgi:hypothetical protein